MTSDLDQSLAQCELEELNYGDTRMVYLEEEASVY